MKSILRLTCISILFLGCSPKLKIYPIHGLMENIKIKDDNYYFKDLDGSYERLKGSWMWTNKTDTLILKSTPIYKEKYQAKTFDTTNTYRDTNRITVRYVQNGKEVIDELGSSISNNCLFADHLGIYTTMFYLYNKCVIARFNHPVLMFTGNDLVLVNKWNEEEGVFLEKENEYKIVIPRTITLKRIE